MCDPYTRRCRLSCNRRWPDGRRNTYLFGRSLGIPRSGPGPGCPTQFDQAPATIRTIALAGTRTDSIPAVTLSPAAQGQHAGAVSRQDHSIPEVISGSTVPALMWPGPLKKRCLGAHSRVLTVGDDTGSVWPTGAAPGLQNRGAELRWRSVSHDGAAVRALVSDSTHQAILTT
jgi:hypothetical protein